MFHLITTKWLTSAWASAPLRVAAQRSLTVGLLIAACVFLFFYRLADRDLWSSHEGRAAQNAQTILREGRWALPKLFDGHPELQKPPLYYWLVALAAGVRGGPVDAWAVRLPAALSALGGVLLVFCFLSARGRPVAGLIAALVLATALHYTWMARVGRIDMPLSLAVGVALVCFANAKCKVQNAKREDSQTTSSFCILRSAFCIGAYVAIAAAVMLKGPIGAVLPAVVLVLAAAIERDRRLFRSTWWGVPLVLALTVPWFVWVNQETHGDFFRVFFWHHNVERGLGSADDLRVHPWWYYGPRWLLDFLPWSPLVLVAAWYLLRRCWRDDGEARFGLIWLVGVLVLLSCARFKRADYLLPAYPGAAILLGCMAERWYRAATRPRLLAGTLALTVVGCMAGWWIFVAQVLPRWEPALDQRPFAREIRRHVPASQFVLFFRAETHALAYHLGYPLDTFLEWENLDIWAGRPGTYYIVMPVACAAEWSQHVTSGQLVEVVRNADLAAGVPPHQQLVLMRTCPSSPE